MIIKEVIAGCPLHTAQVVSHLIILTLVSDHNKWSYYHRNSLRWAHCLLHIVWQTLNRDSTKYLLFTVMSLWLQIICACANLKHAANSWFMKTEGLAQNSGRLWNYGIARSDRGREHLVRCALCIIVSRVDPVCAIVFVKYQRWKTLSTDKIQS